MISGAELEELMELRECLRLAMETVEDVYWRYGKLYVPDMLRLRTAAGTLNDKHRKDIPPTALATSGLPNNKDQPHAELEHGGPDAGLVCSRCGSPWPAFDDEPSTHKCGSGEYLNGTPDEKAT